MAGLSEAVNTFVSASRQYLAGDLPGALEELTKAELLARSFGDEALLVSILAQKAGWLREAGRADQGRQVLRQAENVFTRLPTEQRSMADAALRLEHGIIASRSGDFSRAERRLREAESEARGQSWGDVILADILSNVAAVYLHQGRLEEAQTALTEAVTLDRKIRNTRALSNDLNMLGLLYGVMGDRATQDLYFQEALKEAQEGGFIKEAADAIYNIAVSLDYSDRSQEAEASLNLALKLYEDIGNECEKANVKSSLGIIAARKGDLEKSRHLLEHAQQLHTQTGHTIFAIYDLLNLAQILLNAGQAESAHAYAVKATQEAEAHSLIEILWVAYLVLARTRSASLKTSTDQSKLIEALINEVLPAYAKAADSVELLRCGIGRPEERQHLLWNKEDLYGEAILLAGLLRQPSNALVFSERARARAFLDVMGATRLERTAGKHPLTQRRQELIRQVLEIRASDTEKARQWVNELRFVRAQIGADAPQIAALTEAHMPSLQAIRNAIPSNTALIEYFLGPGSCLTVFVVTAKGIAVTTIDLGTFNLPSKIAQFRAELEHEVEGVPTGKELFYVLLGNVWDVLGPMERLLIVPHRELHYLPFGALWFRNFGKGPKRVYLFQRFMYSILPSAASLPLYVEVSRPPFTRGQARVIGNPTGDLPFAQSEARLVASHLGVEPLLQGQATRASLLEAPSDLAVIHVASHGIYDELDPLLSAVVLADGLVTAEDIMESTISAGLLTLSGCVTGLAERRPGDELVGLARAAASAGVPSIITSLWAIWDDSSRAFFDFFYRCLLKGMPKDRALVATQEALLASEEFTHPVHWAPFVLIGDWR